jgi:hypothetical protein
VSSAGWACTIPARPPASDPGPFSGVRATSATRYSGAQLRTLVTNHCQWRSAGVPVAADAATSSVVRLAAGDAPSREHAASVSDAAQMIASHRVRTVPPPFVLVAAARRAI